MDEMHQGLQELSPSLAKGLEAIDAIDRRVGLLYGNVDADYHKMVPESMKELTPEVAGNIIKELDEIRSRVIKLLEAGYEHEDLHKALDPKKMPSEREFAAKRSEQIESIQRPTGRELQRTPLALGPEGEGGLMMRYARGRGLGQARPGYKETPQAHRVSAGTGPIKPLADSYFGGPGRSQIPSGFNPRGATYSQGPGQKPAVFIGEGADPSTLFHESLHGNFAYLDLHRDLHDVVTSAMSKKLSRGFMGDLADNWARDPSIEAEEVYTYLSEFIRMGDQPNLQLMAEWDDGYANMLQWYTETTQKLLGRVASLPDSVHKRALERRLKFTQLKAAGDVELINHGPHQLEGDIVDFINGQWWW